MKKPFKDWYVQHDDEFFKKFEGITNKRARRPDLHAFLLLDELFPGERDIVASAGHDEIWLDYTGSEEMTEDQAIELIRCGVMFDEDNASLAMFV